MRSNIHKCRECLLNIGIEWIGYAAAIISTSCYLPQAIHILQHRQTAGISALAYVMLASGMVLWLVYGLCRHSWPLVACNGVSLLLVLVILAMKIRWDQRGRS